MLVTNLAYRDLETRADSLADFLGQWVRRLLRRPATPTPAADALSGPAPRRHAHVRLLGPVDDDRSIQPSIGPDPGEAFRWRRHPQLLGKADPGTPVDSGELERSARSAAVRGLFLARSGRIDEARSAFAIAATESSVDLADIPGFWELSRAGMLAAVGAYDDVERFRDASALGAQIRLTYRPRPLSVVPGKVIGRRSASGS